MIVADTNLVVHFLIETKETAAAQKCSERDPVWIASPVWRNEFVNALAQHVRLRGLAPQIAMEALQTADELVETKVLRGQDEAVIAWAVRHGCATYDAEFAILAESANVRVVTADKPFLLRLGDRGISIEDFAAGR